ncbi:membrane protein of unknown function (plasmid) [Azospirillum baldaniorum]|uniref:PAS domain S-box protein n=1 Tax=Azospirillum baldaniorum TaxID=1064539 RepID=A0A9P1JUT5_9PROT|nr:MASE3 domain-containing protein [Azospirillum baldaniorum]CCD00176.1 membrane protein of unknown function [Azospirillum baldaniorum]
MSGTQPSAIRSTFTRWLRDRSFLSGLTALLILMAVLGTVMRHNYLLFHLCAELFAVAVAMTIFTIAWNTRDTNQSPFLAFVGLSMPGIALLDLLHAIAFPGMNVIGEAGANQSTQLWIAARGLQAAVFLAAPLLTEKRLRTGDVLLIQAAVVACTLLSIFTFDIMPDSFVPDVGLTPFKVGAEYAFSAAAVVACLLLCRKRRQFEPRVFGLTFAGIALLAPQELIFTLYTDPHGAMNALGHFIKILSFYLLYRAIIVTALQNPYDLAFYRMRRSEEALRDHLSGLESLIATRTAELRESEARWRALLECSNDWFWETDERGRFTALSPRAQESTGRGGAELLGFTHADLLDRNRPEEDFPALTEALHRREPFRRLSFPLASPGGSARWVMVSGTPRYDGNGAFLGYRGTTSDISARRQSAEAARQKQTMAALGSLVGGPRPRDQQPAATGHQPVRSGARPRRRGSQAPHLSERHPRQRGESPHDHARRPSVRPCRGGRVAAGQPGGGRAFRPGTRRPLDAGVHRDARAAGARPERGDHHRDRTDPGPSQPDPERPRCHAAGRHPDHRRPFPEPEGTGRIPPPARRGRLCAADRRRHRHGYGRGDAPARVRPLLHHQAGRHRDWAWAFGGIWYRTERGRRHPGGERPRTRNVLHHRPAHRPDRWTGPNDTWDAGSWRRCWSLRIRPPCGWRSPK